jgi:membrane protein DedA with SNARE-associated domain
MPHLLAMRVYPLIARYGYPVLLPIAVIEGPIAAAVTGALVAAGQFNGWVACLLLVGADLVGDALYYALGRYGHGHLLERINRYLRITPERLKPLEARFRNHASKLVLIGKTQALGGLILYFAGASRMPFGRYMALNMAGTFPKVLLFGSVGFFLGQSILQTSTQRYVDYAAIIASVAIAAFLLGSYWLVRRRLLKDLVEDIST